MMVSDLFCVEWDGVKPRLTGYLIIEADFKFTMKIVSDSVGKSNGLLAVNNAIQRKQRTVTS